ncbi:DUF1353 domain-containing protein [Oricola indica]|jgi:hypothetical protein|uniref:DUF1353 domain-containing protein n=1 Tax=Oricola indica TaxID=2872591 RepID=UPI001CBC4F31|nr:DUF1353 domain-containing protein [Oricola indica]
MSAYTTHFAVEPAGGILFRMMAPLAWHVGAMDGPIYVVPSGFVFDVSIPWPLRLVFDVREPRYLKAAALHDHMLKAGWNRLTAAGEFHEALKADGVPLARRLVMYLAVALWQFR